MSDHPDDARRRWLRAGVGLASGLGAGSTAGLTSVAMAGTAATAAASAAPSGGAADEDSLPFGLGVASGTPAGDRVILWTRLVRPLGPDPRSGGPGEGSEGSEGRGRDGSGDSPAPPTVASGRNGEIDADTFSEAFADPFDPGEVEVSWRITLDPAMRNPVASGRVRARPADGHSVRVEVRGLSPDRWYWYRFEAAGGRSRIGRTRTLPAPRAVASRLRIAVASCQNFEHGYYASWRHIVADEPDLIVHVGDYIYEVTWGSRLVRPLGLPPARTLADYRQRYAIYRRDPDLQAAHAAAPWFVVWDDHEVENDYAGWTPGRLDHGEAFAARRRAAYQAWFEHMPVPPTMAPRDGETTLYRAATLGDLMTLYLLDTRQYRSPQACPRPGQAGGSVVDPANCAALTDPARTLLGTAQQAWLAKAFDASTTRWNVIAQQTLMAPLALPSKDGTALTRTDGWDGYPLARQQVLEAMAGTRLANPVVVGGDLHAFHVADLHAGARADQPVLAAEFVGTSISSQAAGQAHYDRLVQANPHLHYANGTQRGYLRIDLRRDRVEVDLMGLDDVRRADSAVARQSGWVVERGRPGAQKAG